MKNLETTPELASIIGAIPPEVMVKLQSELGALEASLLAFDPQMKNHLRESHRLLISYPETVHLLEDNEISGLLAAAQKHMQVQIVSEAAKGKGSAKKTKPSVDDL